MKPQPLDPADSAARLFYYYPAWRAVLLTLFAAITLIGPPLLWQSYGETLVRFFSRASLLAWVVPYCYTLLSVFVAFMLSRELQLYHEHKNDRLRLAGLYRNLAEAATSHITLLATRKAEYQAVPKDSRQRTDFINGYLKTIELIAGQLEFPRLSELLDRGTMRLAIELRIRTTTALIGAYHELSTAKLSMENENKPIPDNALRSEAESAWKQLGTVIQADLRTAKIWFDQVNDRLVRLAGERVTLDLPEEIARPIKDIVEEKNV